MADTQAAADGGIPARTRSRSTGTRSAAVRRPAKKTPPWTPVLGRIPVLDLSPQQPDDLWPAKAFDGEVVPFSATVFKEGHDVIDAAVVLTAPSGRVVRRPMVQVNPGLGRWTASLQVDEVGPWTWHVEAWLDDWGTWLHDAGIKIPAGIDVALMLEEGARLLERAADNIDPRRKLSSLSDDELEAELSRRRASRDADLAVQVARAQVDAPSKPASSPAGSPSAPAASAPSAGPSTTPS
ncbi:maltotransferase domain-containing protein, partial [uncultured Amnibacterium sp.]|uniref:maltotransferase domain-containing protein n=1 Tax=uncultured Amnibacterium sp. TaxID=1631851 RepID=UPI0035CBD56B